MFKKLLLASSISLAFSVGASANTELTMYYPIAVGGPLTDVVDGLIEEFESENPDITVKAVYSGNYDETRVRALSALRAGDDVQLSVLGALDTHDLVEQGLVDAFSDLVSSEEDRQWLEGFYPALMANRSEEHTSELQSRGH